MIQVISVRESPSYKEQAIKFTAACWPEIDQVIYEDCINHLATSEASLPQWYLLIKGHSIIGCAGLISNDFISRMDLYPWLCALYIVPEFRGNGYSRYLIAKAKQDTQLMGLEQLYLCTDLVGFYEKQEFDYLALGYHPWGETSRIYVCQLDN